jgi:hypothetical protein
MKNTTLTQAAVAAILAGTTALAVAQDSTTAYCSLPGELVSSDAAGDATLVGLPSPIPDHDVLDVHIAEVPNAEGVQKVYFTLKIDPLLPAAFPLSSYQVKFFLKDGVERFVLFNPYPTPAELNPVTGLLISNSDLMFAFGSNDVDPVTGNGTFTIEGAADAESNAAADGTITIVLSEKQLRALQPGVELKDIFGVAQFNGIVVTTDVDASDALGTYTLKGNGSCSDAAAKGAFEKFGGGAFGFLVLLPLLAFAGLRRRS